MAVSAMSAIPALKETQQFVKTRMDKAVNDFRNNLASTRTGRANVQMLDQVRVNYYGSMMPINQLAQLRSLGDRGNRKGPARRRHQLQSAEQRRRHPPESSSHDRGAAQGCRQAAQP
jgi:hypothetical protein